MNSLTMVSWQKGIQTVSLIELVRQSSTGSLIQAKTKVESLLSGQHVALEFQSEQLMVEFEKKAQMLGVVFQ
jgi:hypothetical protein